MKLHQHLFGNGKPLRCNAWAKPRRCAYICINYIYIHIIGMQLAVGVGRMHFFQVASGLSEDSEDFRELITPDSDRHRLIDF